MTRPTEGLVLVGLVVSAAACGNDSNFNLRRLDSIGVTVGDFDNVQEPFNRMEVDTVRYDGIISTATWVEDEEDFTAPALSVEGLFFSDRNQELLEHGALFVASGTRGFGERQYNSLQPDDQIVGVQEAVDNAYSFARSGSVLVLTDWAYDMVPRAFPGKLDFLGDEAVLDAAQRGEIGRVQARIVDDELAEALEVDQLSLTYNFSNWAVIEDVLDENSVRVWMRGDVSYRDDAGGGTIELTDVPLLVSIDVGGEGGGEVLVSTFHLDAQNPAVIDKMLTTIVGEFQLETTAQQSGEAE
jgi:hypothetical protein